MCRHAANSVVGMLRLPLMFYATQRSCSGSPLPLAQSAGTIACGKQENKRTKKCVSAAEVIVTASQPVHRVMYFLSTCFRTRARR